MSSTTEQKQQQQQNSMDTKQPNRKYTPSIRYNNFFHNFVNYNIKNDFVT